VLHGVLTDSRPKKEMSDYLSTTPADGILAAPLSPPTEIRHFLKNGSFGQNTSLVVAEEEQKMTSDRMPL
jgi:hypothetical protein